MNLHRNPIGHEWRMPDAWDESVARWDYSNNLWNTDDLNPDTPDTPGKPDTPVRPDTPDTPDPKGTPDTDD